MAEFWVKKITKNFERDARQIAALQAKGWVPVVIWEHDFKNGKYKDILSGLGRKNAPEAA